VPALVTKETFELAQERLEFNKKLSPRHTLEPSVLQGLLVCAQCGYALCRMNCPSSAGGRLRYYRCSGLDRPQGKVCQARPVRLEQLDELVWGQVWQLLNQPELIRSEIERRLQEHQQSSPVEQRREQVTKEIVRLEQQTNKLLDAYQEGLMEMGELRQRMPELKKRQQTLKKELESLALQAIEHGRLVEMNISMERFMEQLRNSGQRLDVEQKQKIVRLLVRQVDVGPDSVTIHHSIRLSPHLDGQKAPDYRLCMSRRHG
jgi:site-specific DNA recombinase